MEMVMNTQNDSMMFADESCKDLPVTQGLWKVLIVDDEEEVHHVTKLVLSDFIFNNRKLEFLSAYSEAEARNLLNRHNDVAVVLLDVVMERDDSGLKLVRYIREELKNHLVRIILRTGQPGRAPESNVILEYDINDYKEKTELTAQKLFTTMVATIRSYRDIVTIDRSRKGLEKIIHASSRIFEVQSLKKFASGVLEQLCSLLNMDNDAIYSTMSGITAAREDDGFTILAATGIYQHGIGKRIEEVLSEPAQKLIYSAYKSHESIYQSNMYAGYIETKSGSQNILYLDGCFNLNELDLELIRIYCVNVAIAFENIYLNQEIERNHQELIFTLGDIIERRSQETGNHVKRVAEYARLLSELAGLDEVESEMIFVASAVHDIGKIAIPDMVLNKAGRLDNAEFEEMKRHTSYGAEMMKFSRRKLFKLALTIAEQHHEHWDGSGYPKGLKGEEIDISARIVAIADVFDALTSNRVYRSAWEVKDALQYIQDNIGKQFDPELAQKFLENIDQFLTIRAAFPN